MAKKSIKKKKQTRIAAKKKSKNPVKTAAKKARNAFAKPVGLVKHFYGGIGVAVIKFGHEIKVGAEIHIKGVTTDFKDKIISIQYDHKPLAKAKKNALVGVKMKKRVREGDKIYLLKAR